MNSMKDQDSDSNEDFKWNDYLFETNSSSAPPECFHQASVPPENKFQENTLLEAADPRFPNMFCAAKVISKFGPKIRLRMLGSGSNDDFWTIVDSKLISPSGAAEKRGSFLQPPFNSQRDTVGWAKFLKKTLSAPDAILAPNDCFVPEPARPSSNKFKVGQKLEACDLKDTTFVCPATVVELKSDRIRIEFDGWNTSDWVRYDSREIFPVGWWEKAGISINPPPKRIVHGLSKKPCSSGSGGTPSSVAAPPQQQQPFEEHPVEDPFVNIFESVVPSLSAKKDKESLPSIFRPYANDRDSPLLFKSSTPTADDQRSTSNGSAASSVHGEQQRRRDLPKHTARKSTMQFVASPTTSSVVHRGDVASSTTPMTRPDVASTPSPSPLFVSTVDNGKFSTTVPSSPKVGGVAYGNGLSSAKRKAPSPSPNVFGADDNDTFVVYVNTGCSAGKWLSAEKLASAAHCFGPGPVNHVMQLCLQLLIDCAKDTGRVYHSMPSGDGARSVEADFDGSKRVRHLPVFSSFFDGWKCLAGVLDALQACPHLFSGQLGLGSCLGCPAANAALKKAKLSQQSFNESPGDYGRKRHLSGESSSSTCTEKEMVTGVKESNVQRWSVDDVFRFVCTVGDNGSAELFKKQEIDGKALMLLTADMMIRYMTVRLGPALKIANAIEKLKTSSKASSLISD